MKQCETFEKNNKFLKHFTAADQYFLCKTLHAQNHSLILLTVPDIFLNKWIPASINFTFTGTPIETQTKEFIHQYLKMWLTCIVKVKTSHESKGILFLICTLFLECFSYLFI